jgi:hypothetical protein
MRGAVVASAGRGISSGSDGRCLMDIRFSVERRCGARQVNGVWCDVWSREGDLHAVHELASQHADRLREAGFTVRVRPLVL